MTRKGKALTATLALAFVLTLAYNLAGHPDMPWTPTAPVGCLAPAEVMVITEDMPTWNARMGNGWWPR